MSDERYDRSADMRLLELSREALGVPARAIQATPESDADSLVDAEATREDDGELEVESYVASGTILIATIDARPRAALVPGALVTVSLSIANNGDAAAREVRLSLALPLDAAYRPGTLAIDAQAGSDAIAQALFENGAELENIGPGLRRTVSLQLLVEAGTNDVILTPHLSAASGAVLGLRAMRLTRRMPTVRGLVERPFYESDDAEHEVEPLAAPPPRPIIAVLQPREYPPVIQAEPQREVLPADFHAPVVIEPRPVVATAPLVSAPVAPLARAPVAPLVTERLARNAAATITQATSQTVAVSFSEPAPPKPTVTVPVAKTLTVPGPNRAEMVARIVAEARAKHAVKVEKTAAGAIATLRPTTQPIAKSVAEIIDARTLRPVAEPVARAEQNHTVDTALTPLSEVPKRETSVIEAQAPATPLEKSKRKASVVEAKAPATPLEKSKRKAGVVETKAPATLLEKSKRKANVVEAKAPRTLLEKPKRKASVHVHSVLDPDAKKIAHSKVEVVRSVDDRYSLTGQSDPATKQGELIVIARIDRVRPSTLRGCFQGPSLDVIVDYVVLNALAARDPLLVDDTNSASAAFGVRQKQLLSRAIDALQPAGIDARSRPAPGPGSLATVSLSVTNEGDAAARKVRSCLTLPVDTAYYPGTLAIDEPTDGDAAAHALFEADAEFENIGPGLRRSLTLQLFVEAGPADVILTPQLSAPSGAAIGLRAMRLEPVVNSQLEVTKKSAADSVHSPTLRPRANPVASIGKKRTPRSERLAGPRIEVVRSTDDRLMLAGQGGPTLSVRIDRRRRSTLKVYLCVALPVETANRPGTLSIDTRAGSDVIARALTENGAEPATTGQDRILNLRLLIEAGTNDLMLTPKLSTASGATLDLSTTRSTRRVPTVRGSIEPLAPRAPKPVAEEIKTRNHRPVGKSATIAAPKRGADSKEKPTESEKPVPKSIAVPKSIVVSNSIARPKLDVVRSIDDRFTFAGQGGPLLSVRIDRRRLSTLTGFFKGPSLGMIAHYLVLNALATRDPLPGDSADGAIAAFVASQEQLLSRALISMRLGKTPAPDSVGAALPSFPTTLAMHREHRTIDSPPPGEAVLFRAFTPAETAAMKRMLANDKGPPFMRAAQLFVGLCATDAIVLDQRERQTVDLALTAYAALATAEISGIFLNPTAAGEPDLFKTTGTTFDDAAKAVLAAIAHVIE